MISKDKFANLYYRAFPSRRGAAGLDTLFFFGGGVDDIDWGLLASEQATTHLARCYEALEAYDEGGSEEGGDDPSCAPFCGCETCVVREILYAAWGTIAQATLAGAVVEYDRS